MEVNVLKSKNNFIFYALSVLSIILMFQSVSIKALKKNPYSLNQESYSTLTKDSYSPYPYLEELMKQKTVLDLYMYYLNELYDKNDVSLTAKGDMVTEMNGVASAFSREFETDLSFDEDAHTIYSLFISFVRQLEVNTASLSEYSAQYNEHIESYENLVRISNKLVDQYQLINDTENLNNSDKRLISTQIDKLQKEVSLAQYAESEIFEKIIANIYLE